MILNATAFTAGADDPLATADAAVLQVILAGERGAGLARRDARAGAARSRDARGAAGAGRADRGLGGVVQGAGPSATRAPRRALARHLPVADRVAHIARLAAAWARLRATPAAERRIGDRDGQLPAARRAAGQRGRARHAGELRRGAAGALRRRLPGRADPGRRRRAGAPAGGRADQRAGRSRGARGARGAAARALPRAVRFTVRAGPRAACWSAGGRPKPIRMSWATRFALSVLPLGNVVVGLQPARGYHVDPAATYHAPDLDPPHGYLAFYLWLRHELGAHAIVHLGKHGNLEWLPGKAHGAVGRLPARGGAGAVAASLSVHRQRSRRGHAGQAAGRGRDRRSPDPAADPGRELGRARRAGGAGRRVL